MNCSYYLYICTVNSDKQKKDTMKILTYNNRTLVTFNIEAKGNAFVDMSNQITALARKHNAQSMLFENKPAFIFGKLPNGETGCAASMGNEGGTITFHSHSCNHSAASQELINLLLSFGVPQPKYFIERVETHKADGTAYKKAKHRIYEL